MARCAVNKLSHMRTFFHCHHPSWMLLTPEAKNGFLFCTIHTINSLFQICIEPILHVQSDCSKAIKKESWHEKFDFHFPYDHNSRKSCTKYMWITLDYFIHQSYLEMNFKFLRACMKLEQCLNDSWKKPSCLMVVYKKRERNIKWEWELEKYLTSSFTTKKEYNI